MRHFEALWLPVAMLLLTPALGSAGQGDPWIGTRVVTRSRDVKPRIGTQVVDSGKQFRVYRVERVQGEWLWVVASDVRGWIQARDAIPYDQALEVYTEQIRTRPTAEAYARRGNLWLEKTQYEIAITDFTEAIRLDPKDAEAYARRGDTRLTRMIATARSYGERSGSHAILRDDSDRVSMEQLVRRDVDQILDDYQKTLGLEPSNGKALLNSGVAWLVKGEPDRAVGCLDEAIRIDPKSSAAHHTRSRAWGARGNEEKARVDLDTALRLDPENIEVLEDRVNADDSMGQHDQLIIDASALLKIAPQHVNAYILRGNAWSAKKQYARARADYEAALRIDRGNEIASFNLRGVSERMSLKHP